MKVKKLSYKDFLKRLQLCPRISVELLMENKRGEILFIKRKIPPFEDYWHLPGGFLLKEESIEKCVKRLAKEETGTNFKGNGNFIGLFENIKGDPRGHILHYVLRIKTEDSFGREDLSFFKKIPEATVSYQKDFLIKLGYK